MPENTIYVGRGSRWGNPYKIGQTQVRYPGIKGQLWELEGRAGKPSGEQVRFVHPDMTVTWHQVEDATPAQCVELYRRWITRRIKEGSIDLTPLAGKNLACWCPIDAPCHADLLLQLANGGDRQ